MARGPTGIDPGRAPLLAALPDEARVQPPDTVQHLVSAAAGETAR